MKHDDLMTLDKEFEHYFRAVERAGNEDRCFLCRRSSADVKAFFGFHEDGTPIDADEYGIEDVVLDPSVDIMSYRGIRPVCSVCQLNLDTIFMSSNGHAVLAALLREMEQERDRLWDRRSPAGSGEASGQDAEHGHLGPDPDPNR